MRMRRSLAGFMTALALVTGGTLTACEAAPDARTGTPKDTAKNTDGSDPGGVSQGNVPRNDSNDSSGNEDRDENENGDQN